MDKHIFNDYLKLKRPAYMFASIAILLIPVALGIYVLLDNRSDHKEPIEVPSAVEKTEVSSVVDETSKTASEILDGMIHDPIIGQYIRANAVLSLELLDLDADISSLTPISGNADDATLIDKGMFFQAFKSLMAYLDPDISYDGMSFRAELKDGSDPDKAAISAILYLNDLSPSTADIHLDIEKEISDIVRKEVDNDTFGTMLVRMMTDRPDTVLVCTVSLDPENTRRRIYLDGGLWMQARSDIMNRISDKLQYDQGLGVLTFELRNSIAADSNIDQCLDAFVSQFAY